MTQSLSRRPVTTGLIGCFAIWWLAAACAPAAPVPAPSSILATPQPMPAVRADTNTTTYFEFQIEKPATRIPESGYPRRPAGATAQGQVVAQFVVDTTGVPVMSTFKVLKETSPAHAAAVRAALVKIRYSPAQIGGKRVNQLVQEEFVF